MTEHHPNIIFSAMIGLFSLLATSFDWAMLSHVESILKIIVLALTVLSILVALIPKLNPNKKQNDKTEINVDLE